MSTEDENAQGKAHSALVDFFVMYKKILSNILVVIALSALMTLSFIGILLDPWGEGQFQAGKITTFLIALMGICGILVIPFFGWIVYWLVGKGRKSHRELLEIHSDFINRSYVTTFELVPHQG